MFKYDWHSDIDNEAFFSHLLLNSGYLAGKEVEGIFKFSIPNRELLSEFTTIIPKSNKNCGIILENLQKNRQLEILEMIRKNDLSEDFMSPCGIGLTPLPLGKHFSIIFQWNTEKAHIAHMI